MYNSMSVYLSHTHTHTRTRTHTHTEKHITLCLLHTHKMLSHCGNSSHMHTHAHIHTHTPTKHSFKSLSDSLSLSLMVLRNAFLCKSSHQRLLNHSLLLLRQRIKNERTRLPLTSSPPHTILPTSSLKRPHSPPDHFNLPGCQGNAPGSEAATGTLSGSLPYKSGHKWII